MAEYYQDRGANDEPPEDKGNGEAEGDADGGQDDIQQVRMSRISARVPESVARGAFSTGAIVLAGAHEFVIDFVLRMGRPHQVVTRVVLPVPVVPQLIEALEGNWAKYVDRFGEPKPLPKPQKPNKPASIQDVYDQLKISDDGQSGCYANTVMVSHGAAEFSFDFITRFFPNAAVSSRVFLAAPHVTPFLESLRKNYAQHQRPRSITPPGTDAGPDESPVDSPPEGGVEGEGNPGASDPSEDHPGDGDPRQGDGENA